MRFVETGLSTKNKVDNRVPVNRAAWAAVDDITCAATAADAAHLTRVVAR